MKWFIVLCYLFLNSSFASSYQSIVQDVQELRKQTLDEVIRTPVDERDVIFQGIRTKLERVLIEDIFPAWYGTDWDFNGITDTPQVGQIACGYFVAQTLKDVGFIFHRNRLAQQASGFIIRTFNEKHEVIRKIGVPIEEFLSAVKEEQGDGLYIVGLDMHVGFLWVEGNDFRFIHSSYYPRNSYVLSEPAIGHNPLNDSNWREAGKLFSTSMIRKWINGQEFPVFTNR